MRAMASEKSVIVKSVSLERTAEFEDSLHVRRISAGRCVF